MHLGEKLGLFLRFYKKMKFKLILNTLKLKLYIKTCIDIIWNYLRVFLPVLIVLQKQKLYTAQFLRFTDVSHLKQINKIACA